MTEATKTGGVALGHSLDASSRNCMYCGKDAGEIKAPDERCRGSVKLRVLATYAVDKLRSGGWISLSDEIVEELGALPG